MGPNWKEGEVRRSGLLKVYSCPIPCLLYFLAWNSWTTSTTGCSCHGLCQTFPHLDDLETWAKNSSPNVHCFCQVLCDRNWFKSYHFIQHTHIYITFLIFFPVFRGTAWKSTMNGLLLWTKDGLLSFKALLCLLYEFLYNIGFLNSYFLVIISNSLRYFVIVRACIPSPSA